MVDLDTLLAEKSYAEVIRLCSDRIKTGGTNEKLSRLYTYKSIALYLITKSQEQKDYSEAWASVESAIKLDEKNVTAYQYKSNILHKLGRYQEAFDVLKIAITLDPLHVVFHQNKAVALYELGRFAEALVSCNEGLALEPERKTLLANKARLLEEHPELLVTGAANETTDSDIVS